MRRARAVLAALAFLAAPARAEAPAGLDDPAFTQPFQRLLAANDTTALDALHQAAEAGNVAALLALPAALDWLRPPLKDRRTYLTVSGAKLADATAAAAPQAADWAGGNPDLAKTDDLIARALRLFDAGEDEKAIGFLLGWINQTGPWAALPDGLFDRPLPALAEYFLLAMRLSDPTNPDPAAARALTIARLKAGSPGAAMALAHLAGLHRPDGPTNPEGAAQIPQIFAGAGLSPGEGEARLQAALPALKLIQGREMPDAKTALAATEYLAATPDLVPLRAACAAACPQSSGTCTAAALLAYGFPQGRGGNAQPFTALIAADAFWATPRGIDLLLVRPLRDASPAQAASPPMLAAIALDACFARVTGQSLP